MQISKEELVGRIKKFANDKGESITEAEAIARANDNVYSELFSVQSSPPQFDQRLSDLIEEQWSKDHGN